MRLLSLTSLALVLALPGCTCKANVSKVNPALVIRPVGVDFGQVKVGDSVGSTLRLEASTSSSVALSAWKLQAGGAPGGAEAFSLGAKPTEIGGLSSATVAITFAPAEFQAYEAILVVESDDPEHPAQRVVLSGIGARPVIEVIPDCASARGCTGSVTVTPPSIDFGAQPLARPQPVDASKLPSVNVVSAGPVALAVSKVEFLGADAAAFAFAGSTTFPSSGLILEPSAGFNLAIRFTPTSEQQASYSARLQITSDDPDHRLVTVGLQGTLRPNQAPVVCANLTRVVPPATGDAPREYGASSDWAPLLTPSAGGYDFTRARDVRPGDLAIFSAQSDRADATRCTTDPEDGRAGLTYEWTLVSTPPGVQGLALAGAATPQVQLRPIVTGEYGLSLMVRDSQARATTVPIRFAVSVKQDLVAQLQWVGASGVDLDLHLVRPSAATAAGDPFSGAFSFFEAGATSTTSGDMNGFAAKSVLPMVAGANFDWGGPGASDDPVLNVDDTGSGPLLENISLNFPENDPKCATASCTYQVLVHYFKDARTPGSPVACSVDGGTGCRDGEACSCGSGARCVADSAPIADAGLGPGKCFAPPHPVVRLFFKGSATPAAEVPLDMLSPPDTLALGAPCQVLSVADVAWPAKSAIGSLPDGGTPPPVVTVHGADGTGRVVTPVTGRFGWRQAGGSLQCSPDITSPTIWYSRQP